MIQGFHTGIPAVRYHADAFCDVPSLSSHMAQILLRESPRKAWYSHPRLNPEYRDEHDGKFDIGTAAHAALLEDDSSRLVIVEADDWRTKAAKEQRQAARDAGKTPILARHYAAVQRMVDVAREFLAKSEISEYWFDAQSEVTGIWQESGVWLRMRADRITKNRRYFMDYKSTENAAPQVFSAQIPRMGYHIQDAFYRRGARALGVVKPEFVFVAQSVNPPHECSLHGCDPALQEIADAEVERAIGIWRQCMKSKMWPTYDGRIHWTIPTAWQMRDHEMRIAEAA